MARGLLLAGPLWVAFAAPLAAQGVAVATQLQVNGIDKRVGALEGQMRAVQRQVFPGGDKRFFAAEPAPAPEPTAPGAPATSALVDLTQRVDRLESEQRNMVGQIEQLQFRLRSVEGEMAKSRSDTEFRLNALEGRATPAAGEGSAAPSDPAAAAALPPPGAAGPVGRDMLKGAAETRRPIARAPGQADAVDRVVPVGEAKPAADPAEEAYRAGYRLYAVGDDAGAATALAAFLAANPKHSRAGHATFWHGRALMRQGQAAPAAKLFLQGYQQFPRSERAPNSLVWLGKALTQLKQPKAACQALDELRKAFPDRLTGALLKEATDARAAAGCAP